MATNKACLNGALGSEFQEGLERVNGAKSGVTVGAFRCEFLVWGDAGVRTFTNDDNLCQRHSPANTGGVSLC